MKTAILLIPETNQKVDLQAYLTACIHRMHAEGYMALCPGIYKLYADIDTGLFIEKTLPISDAVYFFVDFGIDQPMFDVIDKLLNKVPFHYRRLQAADTAKSFMNAYQILKKVADATGIPIDAIKSKSRKRAIVDARHCYFRRCRELDAGSLSSIGELVHADHATVLHGIRKASETREVNQLYESIFNPPVARRQEVKCVPVEKPVLPFRYGDKRDMPEPEVSYPVHEYNTPYHGYTPHQ